MTVSAPVTDYVQKSILTTLGDFIVRGVDIPESFAAGEEGTYLQGKGAGVLPAYDNQMPPLTTKGDLIVQGTTDPTVIAGVADGRVLRSRGVGSIPEWRELFSLLTTQGDLWIQGVANPQRIAAGLLDTYFKGQGAGALPIYEKMALRDTGVKIGNFTRSSSGSLTISDVGFLPSVVLIGGCDGTAANVNLTIGFCTPSADHCLALYDNGVVVSLLNDRVIWISRGGGNDLYAVLSTMNADGFILTFTLAGTCEGDFMYLALP